MKSSRPVVRVGDPLPAILVLRDLGELLGLGHSRVWDLYRAGEFARFELMPRLGNRPRFSGARLQSWIEGTEAEVISDRQPAGRAYFTKARRR